MSEGCQKSGNSGCVRLLNVRTRLDMTGNDILHRGLLFATGLQEQLKRVEKDRQDLLEICHGRLAGV